MSNIERLNNFKRKEHTHLIVIDMLTRNLQVKTIEMRFNAFEQWSEAWTGAGNIGGLLLSKVHPLLCEDQETLAWKATAYDLQTGLIIIDWHAHQNETIFQN